MKAIAWGKNRISGPGPCYVVAEIGHNHQGSRETALQLVRAAAACGVDAVKFQKRCNRTLYTRAMYEQPYDHENSFGPTYGEHRERLELSAADFQVLKRAAEDLGVEFMCTAFDEESADLLETLGIGSYKIASGDLTHTPLIEHVARQGKPIFLSTGASTLPEIRRAYDTVLRHHDRICLLHSVCAYPAEYPELNLNFIPVLQREFPRALVGYSGHDNGILAPVLAYMLGAVVVEKHFTLNHAWKGTDHRFSLEPEGMRKQVRDLRRVDQMKGTGEKSVLPSETAARIKMGKSLYASHDLPAGTVLRREDIDVRSPGGGMPPYLLSELLGRTLALALPEENPITRKHLVHAAAASPSR